ncbi:MAG: DNA-binding protein [Pirellulaceae bacterium]|nr:MAG: DNA-binding protein [Pirellulaceae bacterium]
MIDQPSTACKNSPASGGDRPQRRGLSLLELLAVLTIMGVLAAIVVPRLGSGGAVAKKEACAVQQATIAIQCKLWQREHGRLPRRDLSDIGTDPRYFPEGLPTCPVDQTAYQIHPLTGEVVGHEH